MKTVSTFLLLLLVTVLACGQQLVEYPLGAAPTVTSTQPADASVNVATDTSISAVFSTKMDATTLTTATFTLMQGGAAVPGAISYSDRTATFNPTNVLAGGVAFTATVGTGAKDAAGNALAAPYVWRFTTGDLLDTTAPKVTSTDPADGATDVDINTTVQVTFSEAMSCATLSAATFTLMQGATPIGGAVSCSNSTATLSPTSPLALDSAFTATVTTGAQDLAGNALAADYVWNFSTSSAADVTAPSVTFTDPADGDVGVNVNTTVQVAFDEAMNCLTLNAATFTLMQGALPVLGTVSCMSGTATFTPTSPLALDSAFTATVTSGAQDLAGNALAADYVWDFATGSATDETAPNVTFTDPADGDVGVNVNTTVQVAFDEAMNCLTLNAATFTLMQGALPVLGTVSCMSGTATFTPTSPLALDSAFTATVTSGAQDLAGNALAADYVWDFATDNFPDGTPPSVTFTNPVDGGTNVNANTTVQAAFDEPMDCLTLDNVTFTLMQGIAPVAGMVTCNGTTAVFTPTSPLQNNTNFTATITTGAQDLAGNGLVNDHVWTFLTGPFVGPGQPPIDLGVASTFAILAFNTVTNVNNVGTIVTGDLGISPGAALVGFPPGLVVGATHLGNATAAAAEAALLAAYNDAAGRLGAAVLPGDLSGLTFPPGLYRNSTSVMLSAGNLTLDALGDSNAVFIFQMGSTLTTMPGTQVILSGAAKATNVYWAVGTSATLGTTSSFKGTILAATAITMTTGASIEGRLLAQAAAVDLDTNLITVPAP